MGVLGGVVLLWALTMAVGVLPAGWHTREKLAAKIIGQDRWTAGEQLLESVDPRRWANMVGSANLSNANAAAITACLAAARKTGRAQRCSIRVEAGGSR